MVFLVSRIILPVAILAITSVCNGQGVPEPSIAKGSVIVYDVKENKISYQYTATINKFSEADGVEFNWKTNEKTVRSGTTAMSFSNLSDAKKLLVKLIAGKEELDKDQIRIFFNNDVVVSLVGTKSADIEIDGKENSFLYLATKAETTEIDYGGQKTTIDYTSGDAGDVSIGFITIGNYQLMHTFRSKELLFTLRSIDPR